MDDITPHDKLPKKKFKKTEYDQKYRIEWESEPQFSGEINIK